MSDLISHPFRFASEKVTSSTTTSWFVVATIVLVVIFAITSLNEPSPQATTPSSTAALKAAEAQPLKLDLAPVRAPTELGISTEDLDMTGMSPHGG
jgi:hypothetical protein